ncbi:type I secretion system permease/ATPase [Elioraea sp.]|uniref:type I secretion system permease/ATPase n=1 Tax=Elioraea sp. TaxID=2185103 RepID=UPI003F7071A6
MRAAASVGTAGPPDRDVLGAARKASGTVLPLLLALNLLQLVSGLGLPLFLMSVFDRVFSTLSVPTLGALFIAFAIAMAVMAAAEGLRGVVLQAAGERLARRLAAPAFQAASALGAVQPLRDIEAMRAFAASPASGALLDGLWAPAFVLVLAMLDPAFAVYAVAAAIVLLLLNVLAERSGRSGLIAANMAAARSASEIGAAVRAAEAVVGLGMLGTLSARWRAAEAGALALAGRAVRRGKWVASFARALRMLATGGMVALGALLVIEGRVSAGAMIAANIILGRMLLPFESAAGAFRQFAEAIAAWRRLAEATALPPARRDRMALPRPAARLVADRVVFIPPGADRPVLRGVSFAIGPGEVLGVIGPSGAGKTTLLRLIVGMEAPTAGALTLDGYGTALWERADFARHVGYAPQHLALPDATVAETIARLGPVDPRTVIAAAKAADIHHAIAALPHGYATRLHEAGFLLSGGQRQRLAFARAVHGDPCVVVLDEPDAHLDVAGEAALVAAIERLRARGAAVVLTTHRRGLIVAADRLLVLKQGLVDRYGARGAVLADLEQPPIRLIRGAGEAA